MPELPPLTESVPWWQSASYFAAVTAVTLGAEYIRRILPPPRERTNPDKRFYHKKVDVESDEEYDDDP